MRLDPHDFFYSQLFYYNYIYSFPIRAIALYTQKYGDDKLLWFRRYTYAVLGLATAGVAEHNMLLETGC